MRRVLIMLAAAMLLMGIGQGAHAEQAPRLFVRMTLAAGHDAPMPPIQLIREQHGRLAWRRLARTALEPGAEHAWAMPDSGRLLMKAEGIPAGYTLRATVDGVPQADATRIWLDITRDQRVDYALAQNPAPRFAASVIVTAPVPAHALMLKTGAGEIKAMPGDAVLLPLAPEGRLTMALPEAYPLALDTVHWAGAAQAVADGHCAIEVAPDVFATDAQDTLLKTASLHVALTPVPLPPTMDILPADQPVAVGREIRRALRVTNPALMAQRVSLEYAPDPLRWQVRTLAEAEPTDVREDGTLCWERTLPAATWAEDGEIVPSVTEIPLVLTALPLPEGMGFAEAVHVWRLGAARGEDCIALTAPVITANWAVDTDVLAAGQPAAIIVRITNTGGAPGQANIALTLPEGVRLAAAAQGQAVWQVDIPAAQPHVSAEIERRIDIEMSPDALDVRTGYRDARLTAEVNARQLPALPVALTAARLIATRGFSTGAVAPGEAFDLQWQIVNTGGAPGEAVLVQQLPSGIELLSSPDDGTAPERREDGALIWRVTVPPAQREGQTPGQPGEAVARASLRLSASELRDRAAGRWFIPLPATLNGQALTAQPLQALAADVRVSVAAEPTLLRPGRQCVISIAVENQGVIAAPVAIEADIPAGFALVSSDMGGVPVRTGQTLRWETDLAPDQAHSVVYRLSAGALADNETERENAHAVRVAVARDGSREAAVTWTRIVRPDLWEMLVMDGWIALPLLLLCAVTGVLCFSLMRKRREN